jgi:hypothetical protein
MPSGDGPPGGQIPISAVWEDCYHFAAGGKFARHIKGVPGTLVQPQALNGSDLPVGPLEVGADLSAVAQRGRQALAPKESADLVEP